MTESALLKASDLTRRYGARTALAQVSLSLVRGEVLGLLGVNGAGKTTLIRVLAGVLEPDAGRVEIDGVNLFERPEVARRMIGWLAEDNPLYPELQVAESLDHAAGVRGLGRRERVAASERVCQRLGLTALRRRLIGALSRGQRQRVGLAQALIHEPALLLLDEPSAGLDPVQAREFRGLIAELAVDRAVILSTHLLAEVTACASRVAILHQGRLCHSAALADADDGALELELSADADPGALSGIAGMTRLEVISARQFRLHADDRDALAAATAVRAVERGLRVRRLAPAASTLEARFLAIASSGSAEAAA